jgi:hypothetical protein
MLIFKPDFSSNLPHPMYLSEVSFSSFYNVPYAFAYEHNGYYYAFSPDIEALKPFFKPKGDKTLEEWIKEIFFATDIRPALYPPGQFYKRMWRPPGYIRPELLAPDIKILMQSSIAVELLIQRMQELFTTVEPERKNFSVFGHRIREVLLLACMEVEASWVGVLKEHGYNSNRNRYSTNDYVKLLEPMCLADYEVNLRWYPDFPCFKPFGSWNTSRPTKSLYWYDAYNKTKHDRETKLKEATLLHAIHAVGGAAVMFCAQFGIPEGERLTESIYSMFNIYLVNDRPETAYIPIFGSKWNSTQYNFN